MARTSLKHLTIFAVLALACGANAFAGPKDAEKEKEKEPPPLAASEVSVSPEAQAIFVRRYAVTTDLQRTASGAADAMLQEWKAASASKKYNSDAAEKARNAEACLIYRARRLGVATSSSDINDLKSALASGTRLAWARSKAEHQAEGQTPNVSSDDSACRAAGM